MVVFEKTGIKNSGYGINGFSAVDGKSPQRVNQYHATDRQVMKES